MQEKDQHTTKETNEEGRQLRASGGGCTPPLQCLHTDQHGATPPVRKSPLRPILPSVHPCPFNFPGRTRGGAKELELERGVKVE